MSAQLGLVCECVQGTPLFFFSFVEEKTQQPKACVFETAKERKSEREREKERRSQTEKKVSLCVSHKNSLPLCFVSAVVLKSNKAL